MAKKLALTPKSLWEQINTVTDRFDSWKDAVTGFQGQPIGWKYVFSLFGVDADIRNGGIYQLHHNSTWHLILDAIEGAEAFGVKDLQMTLKDILYYYHRNGRSKMRKRIAPTYFDDMSPKWDKSLEKLEDDYYECFKGRGWDNGLNDLIKAVVKTHKKLLT